MRLPTLLEAITAAHNAGALPSVAPTLTCLEELYAADGSSTQPGQVQACCEKLTAELPWVLSWFPEKIVNNCTKEASKFWSADEGGAGAVLQCLGQKHQEAARGELTADDAEAAARECCGKLPEKAQGFQDLCAEESKLFVELVAKRAKTRVKTPEAAPEARPASKEEGPIAGPGGRPKAKSKTSLEARPGEPEASTALAALFAPRTARCALTLDPLDVLARLALGSPSRFWPGRQGLSRSYLFGGPVSPSPSALPPRPALLPTPAPPATLPAPQRVPPKLALALVPAALGAVALSRALKT